MNSSRSVNFQRGNLGLPNNITARSVGPAYRPQSIFKDSDEPLPHLLAAALIATQRPDSVGTKLIHAVRDGLLSDRFWQQISLYHTMELSHSAAALDIAQVMAATS